MRIKTWFVWSLTWICCVRNCFYSNCMLFCGTLGTGFRYAHWYPGRKPLFSMRVCGFRSEMRDKRFTLSALPDDGRRSSFSRKDPVLSWRDLAWCSAWWERLPHFQAKPHGKTYSGLPLLLPSTVNTLSTTNDSVAMGTGPILRALVWGYGFCSWPRKKHTKLIKIQEECKKGEWIYSLQSHKRRKMLKYDS